MPDEKPETTSMTITREFARIVNTIRGNTGETIQEVLDRVAVPALLKEYRKLQDGLGKYAVLGGEG